LLGHVAIAVIASTSSTWLAGSCCGPVRLLLLFKGRSRELAVLLTVYGPGVHLVVNNNVTSHWLLIVLELHLDLTGCHQSSLFADALIIVIRILLVTGLFAHLLLERSRFLLLQV